MAITRVYTKTGDDGVTSLVGGVKVRKTNARIEAYGTVDELSAHLGLLASWMKDGDDKDLIIRTQRNLFTVCSYLATDKTKNPVGTKGLKNMYWTLELASKLEDAPWPATKDELIDYAIRSGAPLEVLENLQEIEDEGDVYDSIEDIWPDYPTKEDFLFNEDEY